MKNNNQALMLLKMKVMMVLIAIFLIGCGNTSVQTNSAGQVEKSHELTNKQDDLDHVEQQKVEQSSDSKREEVTTHSNSDSEMNSEVVGLLKVKQSDNIVLFHDETQEESMLPKGGYNVYRILESSDHLGTNQYYLSEKEYVYIDQSYVDMAEFFPNMGVSVNEKDVIGTLRVKESDIVLLYDDTSGNSHTVPAGSYNIVRKLETPYQGTFQFFISDSKYFYNASEDEYVEYVEKS